MRASLAIFVYPVATSFLQMHIVSWALLACVAIAGPCSNVFPPRHGSLISYELGNVTYNTTEIGFRGVRGMKVTFGCDPTYKLSSEGMRTRTCDVPWSGVAPLCVGEWCRSTLCYLLNATTDRALLITHISVNSRISYC